MANLQLNTAPAGLTGILVPGDGATFTALSESGDWPATTTLRVQPSTGAEQAIAATVAGALATWALTVAQVTALTGTRTTGSLEARITHGTGDLLRPVAAGRLSILSKWAGIRSPQTLGTVTVGPAGPAGQSAYAAAVDAGYTGTAEQWAAGLAEQRMTAIAAADRAEAAENRARGLVTSSVRANYDPTADAEILTLSIPTGMLDPLDSLILLLPVEA